MSSTKETKAEWTKPVLEKSVMSTATRGGTLFGTDACPPELSSIEQCQS
ncbi:MAG: hypothetical protein AAGC81_04590 [Pseudomonadota bacterium]